MNTFTPQEVAKSYINGNISWVRNCLKNSDFNLVLEVREKVAEIAGENKAKMFVNTMNT